VFEGFSINSAV
jgi:centractin